MLTYIAEIVICCFSLVALRALVYENGYFDLEYKKKFYRLFLMLSGCMLAEMLSVLLNGAPGWTMIPHAIVKSLDYVLTPITAYCFINLVAVRNSWKRLIQVLMGINTVIAILSIFTGWYFFIDAQNYYHHGPFYTVYLISYLITMTVALIEFTCYGKTFPRGYRRSLILIVLLVSLGIIPQEIMSSEIRTVSISLTMGAILLYIHLCGYAQQIQKLRIEEKDMIIMKDPLTDLLNRYAYNSMLHQLEEDRKLLNKMIVVSMDVNGLKALNDSRGHLAGDELIRAAASCIKTSFAPFGYCYRNGGDEFSAFLQVNKETLPKLLDSLRRETSLWRGELIDEVSLSCGYCVASEYPELTIDEMIKKADLAMYKDKALYYMKSGRDRRGNRDVYSAIAGTYLKIFKVNLEEGRYEVIHIDKEEKIPERKDWESISTLLSAFSSMNVLHEEDAERFFEEMNVEKLKEYFASGENEYIFRYRRLVADHYEEVVMDLIKAVEYTKEHPVVLLCVKEIGSGQ